MQDCTPCQDSTAIFTTALDSRILLYLWCCFHIHNIGNSKLNYELDYKSIDQQSQGLICLILSMIYLNLNKDAEIRHTNYETWQD